MLSCLCFVDAESEQSVSVSVDGEESYVTFTESPRQLLPDAMVSTSALTKASVCTKPWLTVLLLRVFCNRVVSLIMDRVIIAITNQVGGIKGLSLNNN